MSKFSLSSDFPAPTREQWLALVDKALKGVSPDEALTTTTYDGIPIRPIYARSLDAEPVNIDPGAPPYTRGFQRERIAANWDIRQRHAARSASDTNAAILDDLAGGVSSIILQMEAPGQFGLTPNLEAIASALAGVHLDMISVVLDAGGDYLGAAQSLLTVWDERGMADAMRRGGFNADPLGTLARTGRSEHSIYDALQTMAHFASANIGKWPNVTFMLASGKPYHEAGASEAEELACLAATTVSYLRALEDEGTAPRKVLPKIALGLATDTELFLSIAKLRAARRLIWRIAEACGAGAAVRSMQITAETSERMMAKRDPYVNMLRTTVASAGAIIGGADAISALPFTWSIGEPDGFARRLARNTQTILAEESSLARVLDPAGGSWYVETITDDLARKAWSIFQEIESQGGMEEALKSGSIQDRIAATAEARTNDAAFAKPELIGVSAYPQIDEPAIEVVPHPAPAPPRGDAIAIRPLIPQRIAEPFETLRDGADEFLARTGARPLVFMANLGTQADYAACVTFAENLFAAGGIAAMQGDSGSDIDAMAGAFKAADTPIACICSSDAIYDELAPRTAKALKDAGAALVFLAARPGSREDDWCTAGVDQFIHAGCDILSALRTAQSALGIGNE